MTGHTLAERLEAYRAGLCMRGHVLAEVGWTKRSRCAECAREDSRRHTMRHSDRLRAQKRAWRQRALERRRETAQ